MGTFGKTPWIIWWAIWFTLSIVTWNPLLFLVTTPFLGTNLVARFRSWWDKKWSF